MLKALLTAAALAGALPTPAQQRQLDYDMTMAEVTALLGEPDATEGGRCGTNTKQAWDCKTWKYKGGGHGLAIVFQRAKSGTVWIVNSWTSY